jgi:alpha-galactosidase
VADLIRADWAAELRLVDVDGDALAVAEGLSRKMIEARGAPVRLAASTERRDLLPGATAIICTVGVGGRRAWEQDVFIPRKYGIFQPVGDTVMPGGTSRALRMVPAMVAIAEDVLDLAPDALFFNYGNPMSPVCRAIRKATGAEVVGLCHGVFYVGHSLAGVLGLPPSQLSYSAVGINHLTWFTHLWADGESVLPRLLRLADERASREDNPSAGPDPFCWHLCHLFRAFPAVGDRHVSEFFPHLFPHGQYYGKTLGVDAFSLEDTIRHGDHAYAEMREHALSREPLPEGYWERTGGEHEQVIEIIGAIRRDAGRVYSVNVPNQGQVPNLPAEAVIECPAVATAGGLRALAQPALPPGIAGLLATRFGWVETVVEAALEGSRAKFIQALLLDGAVDSLDSAARLADELLAAQAEHLPQFAGANA